MNKSYKVSVVIPCFNDGKFLEEAVTSVLEIGRDDVDLIVVDDGSTDEGTIRELDKLLAQGIEVIRQENNGPAAARNTAIRASQGEYILPLDADDHLRSGWIDRAITILNSDPQVGVVYGDAQCFGTRTNYWRVGPFDAGKLLKWNFIHASALYRRSVWEQNSGYDEIILRGLEDWDFWLGAMEHGWQFAYIPEVFFYYRRAEQSLITSTAGHEGQVAEFVAKKHGLLYRQAWLSLAQEHQSIRRTFHNLRKLLKSRLIQKLQK
jgi:glycosyltransferase involved in cell wall biosynthesis